MVSISVKFGGAELLRVVLVLIFGLNSLSQAQSCDLYCHADCSKYFNQQDSQFSDCVSSNVHCSCGLPPTAKVVIAIFGVVFGLAVLACCCGICRKQYSRGHVYTRNIHINPPPQQAAAYPVNAYSFPASVYPNNQPPGFAPSAPVHPGVGGGFLPTNPDASSPFGFNNQNSGLPPSYEQVTGPNAPKPYPVQS